MDVWEALTEAEENEVWRRFRDQFAFRPSTSRREWPGIREPRPSVTYSISGVYGDEGRYVALEADLNAKVLAAFRRCVPPEGRLYALDWQHQGYWFYPHAPNEAANDNAWSVPVLPNGDYYIFLAEDFSFGLFGHPWEQTLCMFGQRLLDAVGAAKPVLFNVVLRQNRQSIAGAS